MKLSMLLQINLVLNYGHEWTEIDGGIKNIEDIAVGDIVKTYNKKTNSVETSNKLGRIEEKIKNLIQMIDENL